MLPSFISQMQDYYNPPGGAPAAQPMDYSQLFNALGKVTPQQISAGGSVAGDLGNVALVANAGTGLQKAGVLASVLEKGGLAAL